MSYKALITLDLPDISDEKRQLFYDILEEEHWVKIDKLTTAWKVEFIGEGDRNSVIETLLNDLTKAKKHSSISKINYALQVGKGQVVNV